MKFNCSVVINRPREIVVRLFSDPENLRSYQEGFISKELISGDEGEKGAVSKMLYRQGKGQMELTETIVRNELPEVFEGWYHHKYMDNTMISRFTELNANQTRYDAEIEYTVFRGVIPKIMAWLFPGVFKKQVQKWLNNFKNFAENM